MFQKLCVIALVVVALSACGSRAERAGQLTVNGQAVSLSLYKALVAAEEQKVERSGATIRSQSPAGQLRKAKIESSVIHELMRDTVIGQLAEAHGIRLTAAELQQRVSIAEQAFGGAVPFEEALQQAGLSRAAFASILRFRVLESQLSRLGGGGPAAIDDAVQKARVVVTIGPCAGGRAYPACLSTAA
jgi:hypothetical protein